jgi:hypothetical protein
VGDTDTHVWAQRLMPLLVQTVSIRNAEVMRPAQRGREGVLARWQWVTRSGTHSLSPTVGAAGHPHGTESALP